MRSLAPNTSRFFVFTAIVALLGAFFYSNQITLDNLVSQAPIEHSEENEAEPASLQSIVEEDIHLPFSIIPPFLVHSFTESGFPTYHHLLPQNLLSPLIRPPLHV